MADPTRSLSILTALRREIELRRTYLDGAADVVEVQVTVKLQAGTTWVKGVDWHESRRSTRPPAVLP